MLFRREKLKLCHIVDLGSQEKDVLFCRRLMEEGVTCLFLRFSSGKRGNEELEKARLLVELCREKDGYCMVYDDALAALNVKASGVYLSKPVPNLRRLREILGPECFIGVQASCMEHLSLIEDERFSYMFDFVGVGPITSSYGKFGDPMGVYQARMMTKRLTKPVVWIGGVKPEELDSYGPQFADGVGVVQAISSLEGAHILSQKLSSLGISSEF